MEFERLVYCNYLIQKYHITLFVLVLNSHKNTHELNAYMNFMTYSSLYSDKLYVQTLDNLFSSSTTLLRSNSISALEGASWLGLDSVGIVLENTLSPSGSLYTAIIWRHRILLN